MSSCWELSNYFLKNHFKNDINLNNPIGTKGKLAKAYANVLKNLWYGESKHFTPFNFKNEISSFQSIVKLSQTI